MDDGAPSRLTARPGAASPPGAEPPPAGLQPVGDAWLAVPDGVRPDEPVALLVLLHGAGGSGRTTVELLGTAAADAGVLVLAPDSRGATWDVIQGGYGPDVERIDAALAAVYSTWRVDPARTVLAGFSDGASYALSLGVANGDVFSHLVAFSPGFMAPDATQGRPPVYVSHGVADRVLPIDVCSRRLVPALRRAGYDVHYTEFDGGHSVPPEIVAEALDWVARASSGTAQA